MSDEQPPKHRNRILQWFEENPLLGAIGSIASIIAIPLAIWLALPPKRILSYKVSSTRAAIVRASEQSDISVQYKGKPVNGNLTAIQIAIWNAGGEPIKHDDILKPIRIDIAYIGEVRSNGGFTNANGILVKNYTFDTNHVRMLEATISKSLALRDETGFRVDTTQITNGVVTVDWKILEKNDVAVIQILFEGQPDVPFMLTGTVIGQPKGPVIGNPPPVSISGPWIFLLLLNHFGADGSNILIVVIWFGLLITIAILSRTHFRRVVRGGSTMDLKVFTIAIGWTLPLAALCFGVLFFLKYYQDWIARNTF